MSLVNETPSRDKNPMSGAVGKHPTSRHRRNTSIRLLGGNMRCASPRSWKPLEPKSVSGRNYSERTKRKARPPLNVLEDCPNVPSNKEIRSTTTRTMETNRKFRNVRTSMEDRMRAVRKSTKRDVGHVYRMIEEQEALESQVLRSSVESDRELVHYLIHTQAALEKRVQAFLLEEKEHEVETIDPVVVLEKTRNREDECSACVHPCVLL